MQLTEIYVGLGQDNFLQLLRGISISGLRTYQLFEHFKARCHIIKLNQDGLKKAAPRLWSRIAEKDADLASDIAQAVLVSHLDMLAAVLNHLGIENTGGFFDKDADVVAKLEGDWQQKVFEEFRERFPPPLLVFYLNHLASEVAPETPIFLPA